MTASNTTTATLNNDAMDSEVVCDDVEDVATSTNGHHTNTNGDIRTSSTNDAAGQAAAAATESKPVIATRKLWLFMLGLMVDAIVSVMVLAPFWPYLRKMENTKQFNHYTLYSSMTDLAFLAALRITASLLAILISFCRAKLPPENPRYDHFDKFHPNGDRKTRAQLEQEALEEPFLPWLFRFLTRPSLSSEIFAVIAQALSIVKCLVRMNYEIGTEKDMDPYHPLFWLAVLCTAFLSAIEVTYLQDVCNVASQCGHERYGGSEADSTGSQSRFGLLRTFSSQLMAPLLENDHTNVDVEQNLVDEPGSGDEAPIIQDENDENVRATSDITGDPSYKAKWTDLLMMCYQDGCMIFAAFFFLLLAAIAQVLIPKYLGNILDALSEAFGGKHNEDTDNRDINMWDVPGFMTNVKLLVGASILAGVFAGLRGSIFTVVGARVNVRLRVKLMDALLSQDIGFFDITKTGDITSRLSSDTTLVGDQIAMNVNVFLRSVVQATGVLFFMVLVSWQLTILAFISVPLITLLSTWYGSYVRALTKVMQQKLADGNSVSEAALGSMSTVRAFDAAEKELSAFEDHMKKYLNMNMKSAIAYYGYSTLSVAIPELIFAIVVFYGGMLVRNNSMTSGELVSFLLYLQSLSDAFSTIGWVFSSLTQAVGAADKVFELMHREPRITRPSQNTTQHLSARVGILGIEATKTRQQRLVGLRPESARGGIVLENVNMYYPARPNRCVLNGLSLKIEPGSIVALVGQSGGGKSSVMSLIQHLYEPSSGRVMFDGIDIHELSPEWLSRNICIVSQEPTLFARSIKKNIMYGLEGTDDEPSDDEIVAAAQLANADSFIQNMPQKYDTEVGERGVQLSGGQKQRIAIARALVRKPKLLLLDEATSALDAESEHLVQQAIDDMLVRGKADGGTSTMTVIIVAHRLSTVRSADRIYVIKEGQVVEEGSHDDLIVDPDGAYSALIKRQMQAQQSLENPTDIAS